MMDLAIKSISTLLNSVTVLINTLVQYC